MSISDPRDWVALFPPGRRLAAAPVDRHQAEEAPAER